MNEYKAYFSSVAERLKLILDLVLHLPTKTAFFWGDDTVARLSDQDRETFKNYLSEVREHQEIVTECKKTIGKRFDYCRERAASTEPPADETPVLMIWGLFDEMLRLYALAMQSVTLSEKISRLLEKYSDEKKAAAAHQSLKAEFEALRADLRADLQAEMLTIREIVEDQHRHAGELWATVPDCIKVIRDLAEFDYGIKIQDGPAETLRIKIQDTLKKQEKRRIETPRKHYYQIKDIAEVAEKCYRGITKSVYCMEFEKIGIPADEVPKQKEKRTRKNK